MFIIEPELELARGWGRQFYKSVAADCLGFEAFFLSAGTAAVADCARPPMTQNMIRK